MGKTYVMPSISEHGGATALTLGAGGTSSEGGGLLPED